MSNRDLPHHHPHLHPLPPPSNYSHLPSLNHHFPNSPPRSDHIDPRPADYKYNPLPPPLPSPDALSRAWEPTPLSPPPHPVTSRPTSFHDILNPANPEDELHKQTRRPPAHSFSPPDFFTQTSSVPLASLSRQKPSLPGYTYNDQSATSNASFASAHHSFPPWPPSLSSPLMSPSRRTDGYIDLTSPVDHSSHRRPQKRSVPAHLDSLDSGEGTSKRRRANPGQDHKRSPTTPQQVSLVDDSNANPLDEALQKQQAEVVKAQQQDGDKVRKLTSLTCVICLDTPKDLTATACGHVFCHECLVNALIAGENRTSRRNEPKRSQCPVCRKAIQRTKAQDVIPLLMKKALATQPRRPSKVKARAI